MLFVTKKVIMARCKICKKFAKIKATFVNGLDNVKLAGSCKHCGYDERDSYEGTDFGWTDIPESKVDYDDWEQLGIDP